MWYYFYDSTYILVIIGALISFLASARVQSAFSRYSRVRSRAGVTGAQAAEHILRSQGIYDVSVERVSGSLTDHYDPARRVLRLSDAVYGSNSIAAVGVAAHECGHAIQHAYGYTPLSIRTALVPVANFGSRASWILIILGLFFGGTTSSVLLQTGILLFCAVVLFQIVTLPVEFNASSRALQLLGNTGLLVSDEVSQTKKVLSAAAMTYVASVAASLLQLLRLLMIANRRNRR